MPQLNSCAKGGKFRHGMSCHVFEESIVIFIQGSGMNLDCLCVCVIQPFGQTPVLVDGP